MSRLVPIPADEAIVAWPLVAPLLSPAIKRAAGLSTEQSVFSRISDRSMQLWASMDGEEIEAAAVTEICEHPGVKVCWITLIGGKNRQNWLDFEPQFAAWAKAHGCRRLMGSARPGWLRVLHGGWRHLWTVIGRDI